MQTIERLVAVNMSKTEPTTTVEWGQLNWRKLEQEVFKLQKRIYQASQRGDTKSVRTLQKTLSNSWSAKCLAVRRVSQDNQGKKTAGIDGVKSLRPDQRLSMAMHLKFTDKSKPVRRVWIPKAGSEEQRPFRFQHHFCKCLKCPIMQGGNS